MNPCSRALGLVVLLSAVIAVLPGRLVADEFHTQFREAATVFHASLDVGQRKAVVLPFDSPERTQIQFTGGPRPGVRIGELTPDQRQALNRMMSLVLSGYGLDMANRVAQQDGPDGLGLYYVTFFGHPAEDENFAWRVAEHHLTLTQMVVADDSLRAFGPILLGYWDCGGR